MPSELNPAEEAVAQFMASRVTYWLGSRVAAKKLNCSPSLVWRWSHGHVSPTKVRYRQLQKLYETLRSRYVDWSRPI